MFRYDCMDETCALTRVPFVYRYSLDHGMKSCKIRLASGYMCLNLAAFLPNCSWLFRSCSAD